MRRATKLPPDVRVWVEGRVLDALANGPMTGAELRDVMGLSNGASNYVIASLRNARAIGRRIESRGRPGRGDKEPIPVYYLICKKPGMHCHKHDPETPTLEQIAKRAAAERAKWDDRRWAQQPGQAVPVRLFVHGARLFGERGWTSNEITQFMGDSEWIVEDAIHGEKRRMA
jgi:hypothetical protein